MYLKCFSEASFEGIWLGKVDGEATVNGSMDVLHGKQEAGFSVCTVTHWMLRMETVWSSG